MQRKKENVKEGRLVKLFLCPYHVESSVKVVKSKTYSKSGYKSEIPVIN